MLQSVILIPISIYAIVFILHLGQNRYHLFRFIFFASITDKSQWEFILEFKFILPKWQLLFPSVETEENNSCDFNFFLNLLLLFILCIYLDYLEWNKLFLTLNILVSHRQRNNSRLFVPGHISKLCLCLILEWHRRTDCLEQWEK